MQHSGGDLEEARGSRERAWIFALLIAPMAVLANGLIGGVLSLLLRQQGVGVAQSSGVISVLTLTQTIYFLWSPVTDFWIRRRTWLIVASWGAAAGVVLAFYRGNLASHGTVAVLFVAGSMCQLVVASCGGMMGALKSEESRRRAGSFYQSGSLALGAVAVFVVALLAEKTSLHTLGWLIAAMIALPSLAALAAPVQDEVKTSGVGEALRKIGAEFKGTFLRWEAIPYTLLMVLPLGSGAAIGLLPGAAKDYGVSGQQVAWMNGFAGAALTALGAMAATLIPVKVRASVGYLSVCLVNALVMVVLWLGPMSAMTYFVGSTLYLFTIGTCYAMFTAVVLEFLGDSGKSGSSRYSIINSLGNVPVAYMTWADGFGYGRWGARGLPATEAVLGGVVAVLFLGWFLMRGKKRVESCR